MVFVRANVWPAMYFRRLRTLIAFISFASARVALGQNVAEVQVAPAAVSIHVGDRTGLLATAFDRIGNVIPTAKITWTSRSPQVAKVDANGTVTGLATGVAIIEAAAGHRTGLSTITVSPAPAAPATPAQTAAPAPAPAAPPPPAEQPGVGALYGQPPGVGAATALRISWPSTPCSRSCWPIRKKNSCSPNFPTPARWRKVRRPPTS